MANPELTLRRDGMFPLTHDELDDNFTYLDDKVESGLVNGSTLKWNSIDEKWERNATLFVDTTASKVGIGVGTNPLTALDVAGDIQCSGVIDGGSF